MEYSGLNEGPKRNGIQQDTYHSDFEIYIKDNKYIFNKVLKNLTALSLHSMMLEDQKIIQKTGIKLILSDVSKVSNKINYIEDYNLLKSNRSSGILINNIKIAILCSPLDQSFYAHETFALNNGYHIKLLKDHDRAIEWLLS